MKPSHISCIIVCVLLGGTWFSRIADGTTTRVAVAYQAPYPSSAALHAFRLQKVYDIGQAEGDVLREIARNLEQKPDTCITVEWIEINRCARAVYRATYQPSEQILRCRRLGGRTRYDYSPVSPAGIHKALRDSDDYALFADANLYSTPRSPL